MPNLRQMLRASGWLGLGGAATVLLLRLVAAAAWSFLLINAVFGVIWALLMVTAVRRRSMLGLISSGASLAAGLRLAGELFPQPAFAQDLQGILTAVAALYTTLFLWRSRVTRYARLEESAAPLPPTSDPAS